MMKFMMVVGFFLGSLSLSHAALATEMRAEAVFSEEILDQEASSLKDRTLSCASGGPVSESFYEYMYKQCYSTCPRLCQSNSTVSGNYYTNGYYKIVCGCHS